MEKKRNNPLSINHIKISPKYRGDFLVYGLFLILEYPEFLQKIGHDEEGDIHGDADYDRGEHFADVHHLGKKVGGFRRCDH